MRRKFFITIVGLFIAAATTLIIIEFIQARHTVHMSNNLFSISVNNAMDDMVEQLNRLKVEDYISQNDRYRLLKFKRIEELTERMQTLVMENYAVFYDTNLVELGVTMVDSVRTLPHVRLTGHDSSVIAQYNTLLATRDHIANSPDFYNQFVSDISAYVIDNIMMPSSFNYSLLDSLITQDLIVNGVEIPPVVGVYDNSSATFLYCNREGKEQALLESPYKYHFQPNGMMNHTDYYIMLQFPLPAMLLRENSTFGFLFRLSLIGVLFILFILLLRMMSRQRELDEMKNDFINNMTHEIKTPIATIGLACQMLQDPTVSTDAANTQTYIGIIGDANSRMRTLVDTILQSARMTDKKATSLNLKEIDLHTLINSVVGSARLRVDSRGGHLECDLQAAPSTLVGDEVHLTNVIFNLVDNAIKYSPDELYVAITTRTENNRLVVSVADHGLGISREDQKHIFEKFYRVSTGDVHNVKGFGIGLSYVQQVVALHHGTVSVDSEPGQGSTFTITLPYPA